MRTGVRQLGRWEWVVALLGAVLLGLLWAPWYAAGDAHLTGWQAFGVTDIVIALLAVACIVQPFVLRTTRSPAVALVWNVCLNWAAVVVIVWIVVELVNTPAGYGDLAWGAWASLAAALGVLGAGWMALTDEHTAQAPEPDVPLRPLPPAGGPGAPPAR